MDASSDEKDSEPSPGPSNGRERPEPLPVPGERFPGYFAAFLTKSTISSLWTL